MLVGMTDDMWIEVARSGGFAGIGKKWGVRVASAPDPDALRQLVDDCPWDDPVPDSRGADYFNYQLTAGDRSATLPESAVYGPWRTLIDYIMKLDDR